MTDRPAGGLRRRAPMPPGRPLPRGDRRLARTGELRRAGPIPASGPPQRTAELARRAPISSAPSPRQRARARTWAEVKVEAWEAAGRRCVVGDHPLPWDEMHGHHRQMSSAGGRDVLANCLPVCHRHHRYVHGLGAASYTAGWLVHPWDDPADVPVVGLGATP